MFSQIEYSHQKINSDDPCMHWVCTSSGSKARPAWPARNSIRTLCILIHMDNVIISKLAISPNMEWWHVHKRMQNPLYVRNVSLIQKTFDMRIVIMEEIW